MNLFEHRNTNIFNSPIEIGLRTLYILSELYPQGCDLQRLVYYDYLLVHSGDAPNGPESIHPNIPHRSTEILVKRELLKSGLKLMNSKELVLIEFDNSGILYKATNLTKPFLEYNSSEYASNLRSISKWLIGMFDNYGDDELARFIKNNIDVWGGEFSNESLLRGFKNEE